MNHWRRRAFLLFAMIYAMTSMTSSFAQSLPVPEGAESDDAYFTSEVLNDENWNDGKLFPSINPKSRPETDPTLESDSYPVLPWYLRKSQVAQLLAGMIQYRVFGIFHHQPKHYQKEYARWANKQSEKFNYLKLHADRFSPAIENSLTFINSKYEYRGISDKAIGYCYGVSTVFKAMSYLAFYSETIAPEDHVPEKGTKEWYKFYIDRMNDVVMKGKAAFFPGFKNLRELTLVPEFEFFLKVRVTKTWKKMVTLKSTLRSYINNTEEMSAEEVSELITDLKSRLSLGEFPKILFASAITKTFLTGGARTHAVLVHKVEEIPAEKRVKIHIWDINFYAEDLIQRPYFIDVQYDDSGKPTLRYQEWANPSHETKKALLRSEIPGDRLGQVIVAGENNREAIESIQAIEKFCKNPPAGHPEVAAECAKGHAP